MIFVIVGMVVVVVVAVVVATIFELVFGGWGWSWCASRMFKVQPLERRPEHRTRNGTGTERERTGTRTREMLVQHLRHSRLPSAFLAAGKTQLGLHKDHLLCGRSICILSRPQNASRISFPFSYLDAWFHFCLTSDLSAFCYGHKMQLGTLACGK